jgi:hypothetical protein
LLDLKPYEIYVSNLSWLFNHTDTLGIEKQVMAEYNKQNFEYLRTEHNLIEKNGVDQMICSKASK